MAPPYRYCERSDIEAIFGAENVRKWADLDNLQNQDTITARIDTACLRATQTVDDTLRYGPYTLPIRVEYSGEYPGTIVDVAATLAGVWLYESRGVQDFNPDTGAAVHVLSYARDRAYQTMQRILAGQIRLDVEMASTDVPEVVDWVTEEE